MIAIGLWLENLVHTDLTKKVEIEKIEVETEIDNLRNSQFAKISGNSSGQVELEQDLMSDLTEGKSFTEVDQGHPIIMVKPSNQRGHVGVWGTPSIHQAGPSNRSSKGEDEIKPILADDKPMVEIESMTGGYSQPVVNGLINANMDKSEAYHDESNNTENWNPGSQSFVL